MSSKKDDYVIVSKDQRLVWLQGTRDECVLAICWATSYSSVQLAAIRKWDRKRRRKWAASKRVRTPYWGYAVEKNLGMAMLKHMHPEFGGLSIWKRWDRSELVCPATEWLRLVRIAERDKDQRLMDIHSYYLPGG